MTKMDVDPTIKLLSDIATESYLSIFKNALEIESLKDEFYIYQLKVSKTLNYCKKKQYFPYIAWKEVFFHNFCKLPQREIFRFLHLTQDCKKIL